MSHVRRLADGIGVRRSGSKGETSAARYIYDTLRRLGYADARIVAVPLPNGRVSHSVSATRRGTEQGTILLGAHIDTKVPSPGANDNASGSGVLLELARDLKGARVAPTVTFVWFGAEEMIDHDGNHHHYGSRAFVRTMPAALRRDLAGMVSVDMVGYGDVFNVRTMGEGPRAMVDLITRRFRDSGVTLRYARDPGRSGWSDHEAFELAGYPVAWLEWNTDPVYHTSGDRASHLQRSRIEDTGRALREFLVSLTARDLARLKDARR
jgi:Zn-dependent M28 family amino/carboxypeptidase